MRRRLPRPAKRVQRSGALSAPPQKDPHAALIAHRGGVSFAGILEERGKVHLPITREKKEELVAEYRELIRNSGALVFTNYRGTKVKQINSLRGRMKDIGGDYVVTKNTLLGIALEQEGRARPEELLAGPNGVVFTSDDVAKSVTALKDWIKEAKVVEITGALLENSALNAEAAEKLSELPTREQVLAQILGTVNAPASSLVRIINAPLASLVRVINAHAEKMQEAA
jgi:large subunit ribosomal protein L10